jgi:hypothetical protein
MSRFHNNGLPQAKSDSLGRWQSDLGIQKRANQVPQKNNPFWL